MNIIDTILIGVLIVLAVAAVIGLGRVIILHSSECAKRDIELVSKIRKDIAAMNPEDKAYYNRKMNQIMWGMWKEEPLPAVTDSNG